MDKVYKAGDVYIAQFTDVDGTIVTQSTDQTDYDAADAILKRITFDRDRRRASKTTPGGANGQIQINSGGEFGGNAYFTLDAVSNVLSYAPGNVALIVNDAGQAKLQAREAIVDCKDGAAYIGDYGGAGNGTTLTVDDAARTITANCPLYASGDLVLRDSGGVPGDAPVAGTVRYDAATDTLYIFDGTNWNVH